MKNKHTPDFATTMAFKPGLWPQWLIVVLCLLWSLIAFAADSDEYLRDAQAYLDKGEVSAAVIQLKNALLVDPDNKEARLLLGKAYLKQKDGLSAEKELRRAQELGAAREAVLVPLGRALLMTGQSDKLLQTITPEAGDSDALQVDILLLQGQAYLATGKLAMADEKFSNALELKPAAAEALLGKARIAYQNQDTAAATELVDRALSSEPDNADAWTLKGELLRNAGQQQEAVSAFQSAHWILTRTTYRPAWDEPRCSSHSVNRTRPMPISTGYWKSIPVCIWPTTSRHWSSINNSNWNRRRRRSSSHSNRHPVICPVTCWPERLPINRNS